MFVDFLQADQNNLGQNGKTDFKFENIQWIIFTEEYLTKPQNPQCKSKRKSTIVLFITKHQNKQKFGTLSCDIKDYQEVSGQLFSIL